MHYSYTLSDVTQELVHMLVAKQRKNIDNLVERAIFTVVGIVELKSPETASGEDNSSPPQAIDPTSSFAKCFPCK